LRRYGNCLETVFKSGLLLEDLDESSLVAKDNYRHNFNFGRNNTLTALSSQQGRIKDLGTVLFTDDLRRSQYSAFLDPGHFRRALRLPRSSSHSPRPDTDATAGLSAPQLNLLHSRPYAYTRISEEEKD
jgi:hypothetical protein